MFAEKSKKMMPELPQRTRQESTHSDIRHPASQIGNQAMLELLRSDKPVTAGVPSLIDEMRGKYGWNRRNTSTSAGVPLPSDLKKEYEESSGVSLDDVKVHYNSDQPERFGAEAFAYGENIFLKPAQESLITHELGHVVQQKQGLVNATHSENSYPVNEDGTLEKQADKPVNHAGKVSRVKVRKVAKPVMQFSKDIDPKHNIRLPRIRQISRPAFSQLVRETYESSRAEGTSIDHVISFENIRAITEEIAKLPAKDRPPHLRRLIKAVMPILNSTQKRDAANQKVMLNKWIKKNRNIRDRRVQAKFFRDMNNSLSNLRLGNASLNSAIREHLDPPKDTIEFGKRKGHGDLPRVKFSNKKLYPISIAQADQFARIKSIHKVARLATELKDRNLFFKPKVADLGVAADSDEHNMKVLSSDFTRQDIPTGLKLIVPHVVVRHRKKDKANRPGYISRYSF